MPEEQETRGCPKCNKKLGRFAVEQDDMPQRQVIETFTVNKADPTLAYRLTCGHTVIDF